MTPIIPDVDPELAERLAKRILESAVASMETAARAYAAVVHCDPVTDELRQRLLATLDALEVVRADA